MRERNRLALHEKLCTILGSRNVYHDPPSTIHMNYPCIVYKRSPESPRYADNKRYIIWYPWDVQIISKDPDFSLFDTFLKYLNSWFDEWVFEYDSDTISSVILKGHNESGTLYLNYEIADEVITSPNLWDVQVEDLEEKVKEYEKKQNS